MATEIHSPDKIKIGRYVLVALVICLLGLMLYKYYWNNPNGYTSIPQEVKLKYMPSEFNTEIDEEDALAVMSNPHRYRREFNEMVYDLNISILDHVASRMGLSSSQKSMVEEEYKKHHPYLRNLYYHDFTQLQDSTSALYQVWYDDASGSAVDALKEVASKYTCFLVNHVMSSLIETQDGSVFAKGQKVDTPCGIALTEALQPMLKRMEERAAIQDFSRSKGLLEEKVEKVIAELATMEQRNKKGINKQLQTKIWGVSVSSSNIEVSAISVIKVGFKLDEYFDINLNSRRGYVTITLPPPTILSHEVYPKVDKLDIGWLREVENVDLNRNFNALRKEFRREAIEEDGLMDKSKTQAIELMNTMFGPVVSSINKRYSLRVKFKEAEEEVYDPELSSRD